MKKIKLIWKMSIIAIFVCFVFIGIAGAENWPMFMHDPEHTGETSDTIKNPENLGLKWKFETDVSDESSPVVYGNYIYFGSEDEYVYCLDKKTGELKWKFLAGGESHSSPAVYENYVYIGSTDGIYSYFYSLNKDTGELKWKFETTNTIHLSPVVSENFVYVGSFNGYIYCLDKDTGELKWEFLISTTRSSPAIFGDYLQNFNQYL